MSDYGGEWKLCIGNETRQLMDQGTEKEEHRMERACDEIFFEGR